MKSDFNNEVIELTGNLKFADSYLECETIALSSIKKHITNGLLLYDECMTGTIILNQQNI